MKLLLHLKDFRFQCYESGTQELIGPSCEMTASKLKYFQNCATGNAPLETRGPGKYCVYRSHTRLYVDFSWDSVARINSFAFGVNAPLVFPIQPRKQYRQSYLFVYQVRILNLYLNVQSFEQV